MPFVKVRWLQAQPDEPILIVSELDAERWEVRKVQIFADGRWGYAHGGEEIGGTFLGERAVPSLSEINADPQFEAVEIEADEFESLWRARLKARPMTPFPDDEQRSS